MWAIVCDFIKLDPKIERTDKMQTIKIEKLEELNDFEWEYKGKKFYLCDEARSLPVLYQRNRINTSGTINSSEIMYISLKNLTELELYGLKVILNEKPKLTSKERDFLEKEIYITRDLNGELYAHFGVPIQKSSYWIPIRSYRARVYTNELFTFITWESGKAWSKRELLELEVVE